MISQAAGNGRLLVDMLRLRANVTLSSVIAKSRWLIGAEPGRQRKRPLFHMRALPTMYPFREIVAAGA